MDLYFRVKLLKRNVAIALCEFSLFFIGLYVFLRLKMVMFGRLLYLFIFSVDCVLFMNKLFLKKKIMIFGYFVYHTHS